MSLRSVFGWLTSAFLLALPSAAHVAPDAAVTRGPHRIHLDLGAAATSTVVDVDGHWQDSGAALAVGAGYGYGVLRWLELGAGARYLSLGDQASAYGGGDLKQHILLPWLGARVHTSSDKPLEFGASVRVGGYFLWLPNVHDDDGSGAHDHAFRGTHASLRPDLRLWISKRFALTAALDATFGGASDTSSVHSYYLDRESALFSVGASAGAVLAL